MRCKKLLVSLLAVSVVFALGGCGGSAGDAADEVQPASMADVTDADMSDAFYLMASAMPEGTSMTGIYIDGATEDDTIRASFTTIGTDGQQADIAAEVESLMRLYSQKCAEAALASAQESGDDQQIEAWQQRVDIESADDEGQGGLYDTYKCIVSITSDDGSLVIDGERQAGADSTWNWQ